ncbi:MAG: Intracellular protease 1 [Methanomassiliicoccales archaeon PtaU1.Bin124]|nr:MAG: Intracellular protease 1 [Methanomassiliicoccales archaeon PtaU1.Bin124]
MHTGILVYDTCAQFEVMFASWILKDKGEVVTYGLEMRDYESMEGFRLRPHRLLEDMIPDEISLFIIPGGQPDVIAGNMILGKKLRGLNDRGKLLAAICGGPVHLGKAGVLQGKRFTTSVYEERKGDFEGGTYVDEDLVEDGNVITAWPNAYADFAIALGRRMNAFKDEAEEQQVIHIIKEFKRE